MSRAPVLVGLSIADDPAAWRRLGFEVDGAACRIGSTALRFEAGAAPAGRILAWTLCGPGEGDVDGLPTRWARAGEGSPSDATAHPNGALSLDHVMVMTPDVGRTTAALEGVGIGCRRVREAHAAGRPGRQAFFRLGEVILEVVGPREPQGTGAATFWGVVAVVEDLDACAARLGEDLGPVRQAVQPGRRIATVRRASGVAVPLALMSPPGAR